MQSNNSKQFNPFSQSSFASSPIKSREQLYTKPQFFQENFNEEQTSSRFSSNPFEISENYGEKCNKLFLQTNEQSKKRFSEVNCKSAVDKQERGSYNSKRNSNLTVDTECRVDLKSIQLKMGRKSEMENHLESVLQAEEELKNIFSKKSDKKISFHQQSMTSVSKLQRFNSVITKPATKRMTSKFETEVSSMLSELKRPQNPHCKDQIFSSTIQFSPEQICSKSAKLSKRQNLENNTIFMHSQESGYDWKQMKDGEESLYSISTSSGDSISNCQTGVNNNLSSRFISLSDILEAEEVQNQQITNNNLLTIQFEGRQD